MVQINKSEVLEPGIYPVTPKVTGWEAPGHIALDEQLMEFTTERGRYDNPKPEQWSFNYGYSFNNGYPLRRFNVDWPLPGELLTDPSRAPGSFLWSFHKMDQNDW